jgi:large subunit ribosomal protein L31
MKKEIHPKLHQASIKCTCGFEIQTSSTRDEQIEVEICSNCHPFYTGKQRFVDTAGRIDRFRKKYGQTNLDQSKK